MLLELVDRILDKGIVIDAWARVSVLSIELLTVEARVVVASVDTYLRYAEAIGNTALASMPRPQSAQQPRVSQAGGQQQLGGQQAGVQQTPALPQPQQQNVMPQWQGQQQAQPQPVRQPAQTQAQPQQGQRPQAPQQAQPQQAQPQAPQQAQPQQAQPQPPQQPLPPQQQQSTQ